MKKTVFLLFLLLPFCYLLAQPPVTTPLPVSFPGIAQPLNDENLIDKDIDGNKNYQVGAQIGNDNYLWLDIDGNKNGFTNPSEYLQKGNRNYADVYQPGDKNRFDIVQKNFSPLPTKNRNKVYINQVGDRNEAIVKQKIKKIPLADTKGKLVAKTWQSGDGNLSRQEQKGKKNRAFVVQKGDKGIAKQWQGGSPVQSGNAFYNNAVILQRAQAKKANAYQYQHGFNNDASIIQSSEKSVAYQVQLNDATAKDNSWDDNVARIKQRDAGGGNSKGNMAYQLQSYNDSYAVGNLGTINQKGSNNVAWQVQIGGKNVDNIKQIGDGNHAETLQIQSGASLPTPISLPFTLPSSILSHL